MATNRPTHDDLKKQAEGWLNSEGYPLEMRTARTFHQTGFFNLYQGLNYFDQTEEKWREVDLSTLDDIPSEWAGIDLFVRAVVECTYSAANSWILFPISEFGTLDYALTWRARCWSASARYMEDAIEAEMLKEKELPTLLELQEPVAYGVVRAGDPQDESDTKRREPPSANLKVRQLLSAVSAMQKAAAPGSWELLIPVLVVDGELFSTRLDEGGHAVIEETHGEGTLIVYRYDSDEPPVAVHVVTAAALQGFCERLRKGLLEFRDRIKPLVPIAIEFANNAVAGRISSK